MSLGTEKIEAILEDIKEIAILGKKISEDKKVDIADLPSVIAFVPKIPKILGDIKAIGEAVEEGKDIDVAEIVGLIQKIDKAIKEIEKA